MAELVELILKLRGGPAFQRDMSKSTQSVDTFGKKSEQAGKKTKGSWKNLAQFAGGAAAVAGATRYLKGAGTATVDLGKSTLALQRQTGMSIKTSSEWASVLKTRGIDAKQFGVGMVKLSKQMTATGPAGDKAQAAFAKMGVSMDAVKSGDVQGVLMQSADAFAAMKNPAEKAAMAQQLFGKQGQNLLPLMGAGAKGIQEQLGLANKYGAVLSETSAGGVKDLIQRQREMQMANEGLKVQIGQALLPVVLSLSEAFAKLVNWLQPILKNSPVLTALIIGLTAAMSAYKVAVMISTLMTLEFNAALLLIPLAVIAIGVGLIYAYKKVGWFRAAVNAVWSAIKVGFNWIKTHWVLIVSILGGPFVAAAILIARNWHRIVQGAKNAITWIKTAFNNFVGFMRGLPARVGHAVSGMWNGLRNGATAAVHWVANRFRDLIRFVSQVPGALKHALGSTFDFVTGMGDTVAGGVGDFAKSLIPGKAEGGPIHRTGPYLVGEKGPEIVRLPRASEVVPNHALASVGAGGGTIVTQVFLDRRQIAEAVGSVASDRLARR